MSFDAHTPYNDPPPLPPREQIESHTVLKACIEARASLAALQQAIRLIPNPSVLINSIPLLEAQASSEIENIVTTTDALFRAADKSEDMADRAIGVLWASLSDGRCRFVMTTDRDWAPIESALVR